MKNSVRFSVRLSVTLVSHS